jgi:hypothetical protein
LGDAWRAWTANSPRLDGAANIPDPARIERQAQADLPLPTLYGNWTVSTDRAVHVDAIQKLFDSGVNIHSGHRGAKQ